MLSLSSKMPMKYERLAQWQAFGTKLGNEYPEDYHGYGDSHHGILVELKIVEKGLCILALNTGEVKLFRVENGQFLFKLNTHTLYKYPKAEVEQAMYEMIKRP